MITALRAAPTPSGAVLVRPSTPAPQHPSTPSIATASRFSHRHSSGPAALSPAWTRIRRVRQTELAQAVEFFAGVGHDERILVGRPRGRVDLRRVEVIEVDRAGNLLADAGGQGDGNPVTLAVDRIPGPGAAQVRGVGQVAPVLIGEAVPLLDEVVPAVITDPRDHWVRPGDLPDVRCVQHDLAAVSHDRLDFIEALR